MNAVRHFLIFALLGTLLSGCGSDTMESIDGLLGRDRESGKEKLTGERVAVMAQAKELQPDTDLQKETMDLPLLPANAAWPQIYATAAGIAGNLPYAGTGESDGSAKMGGGASFGDALVSPPVIAAGMVMAMDGEGAISARTVKDLDTLWHSEILVEEETSLSGGGVAYARGRVVGANGNGHIAALDAQSGKMSWEYKLNLPLRSAPRILGTTILIQTADQQLFAFSLADGHLLWRHRGVGDTASLMAQNSPAAAGNVVVVGYGSGDVIGLSIDTGEELWAVSLSLPGSAGGATSTFGGFAGAPVIEGSIAYAGSANGTLAAIDTRDGQRLWEQALPIRGTPYVSGDYLFVISMTDAIYAIHRHSGKVRWSAQLPRYEDAERQRVPFLWQGPVLASNRLWMISPMGRVIAVSADKGEVAIDRDMKKDIRHSPVIALEKMWLMDSSAHLYSFK